MPNLQESYLNFQGLANGRFVSPYIGVLILISVLFAFNPACHLVYTYELVSGAICRVGFSNDGGTIVSVDNGFGQNVVAFDVASGWIISSTYSFLCRAFLYSFTHRLLIVNSYEWFFG